MLAISILFAMTGCSSGFSSATSASGLSQSSNSSQNPSSTPDPGSTLVVNPTLTPTPTSSPTSSPTMTPTPTPRPTATPTLTPTPPTTSPSPTLAPVCRGGKTGLPGGYMLPAGYLSTKGNQIVDANGDSVRLACTSYYEQADASNIPADLAAMKAYGFNCVRVEWRDATLNVSNPDNASNLSDLQFADQIVAAATPLGLKVILDHHEDEQGTDCDQWSNQVNGLWIDSGPGTDGTNGCGVKGTVTAQVFQDDWVAIATHYSSNSTVIGLDLNNEPQAYPGMSVWGGGGPTDIHQMYETVGNAILAVNPGVLIIAQGPQRYDQCFNGVDICPAGDLTMVKSMPVVLTIANKVVYSVHEYPSSVSAVTPDSGSGVIARMNNAWGYVVTQNIAPVWIGEMGIILTLNSNNTIAPIDSDSAAWAAMMLAYLNGQMGAQGGPTFTATQQAIGTDWWTWGDASAGEFGTLNGTIPLASIQALTKTLMFSPSGCP